MPTMLKTIPPIIAWVIFLLANANADERRAPPPPFSEQEINEVFFPSLQEALGGNAPDLAALRKQMKDAQVTPSAPSSNSKNQGHSTWDGVVSATTLEDEIKRLRLHYDKLVASPGVFRKESKAIQLDLSALATLFAVITEYPGEVRWKKDAATARDLIARTAVNARTASQQVFNEAKKRKAELQDLVSGTGLSNRKDASENDWSKIAGHALLMSYSEQLIDELAQDTRSASSTENHLDEITRRAELLAMLGVIFTKDGMDYAGDEDYDEFSREFTEFSVQTVAAVTRKDIEAVQESVSKIRTRCDACHEVYR